VLVAGPTGSGKTSSSYAPLQEVSGPAVNTVTIEDPVEYALPHATQIGINPKMGVTFGSGLRTVLRQDANVIFVGEMRDQESFAISVRAPLSGHFVVSTLHASDTVSALTALRNRDLDRQVLADALQLLISQHLVQSQVALGVAGGAVLGAVLLFALVQAHVMHPVVRERMPGTMELAGTVLRGLGQQHPGAGAVEAGPKAR